MSNGGVLKLSEFLERKPLFPVPGYRVTGGVTSGHAAWDIAAPRGTPVIAPESGVVTRVQDLSSGLGRNVIIRLQSGVDFVVGHLQSFAFRPGQEVERGEIIGRVGSTGFSSGPHAHVEIRTPGAEIFAGARSATTAFDPISYFGSAVSNSKKWAVSMPALKPTGRRQTLSGEKSTPPQIVPTVQAPSVATGWFEEARARRPMGRQETREDEGVGLDPFGFKAFMKKYLTRLAFGWVGIIFIVVGLFILSSGLRERAGPAAVKIVKVVGGAALGGPAGAAAGAVT